MENHTQKKKELTFSGPQGSCSDVNLFNTYCSKISKELDPNLSIIAFAYNHAIVQEFNPNIPAEEIWIIDLLTNNLVCIKTWMNLVRLKMNNSKSEFIIFGNSVQVDKCSSSELNIDGKTVSRSHLIKYLGR